MLQTSESFGKDTKTMSEVNGQSSSEQQQPKFEEKAQALNHLFDTLDSKLRTGSSSNHFNTSSTSNSTIKMPPGLTLDDMSFWLKYRQEIDYSKPTPFACPPIASYQYTSSESSSTTLEQDHPKRIKAKSAQKRKQQQEPLQPSTTTVLPDEHNDGLSKVFCIKRKRNEEPIETFYIPSIQQTKKTKISDLEKHLANTNLSGESSKKKKDHDFSISPNVSLFKFTLLKDESNQKKKQETHSASLKQIATIDSKSKTTDRLKSHQESLKQKRLLRINEKRREGDKEIVEFGFVQAKEKKTTEELLSPYESLLKQAYGNDSLEELRKLEQAEDDDFEIDYYTVETTNDMQDDDEQPHANAVLRFESFDDQLWLENTLDDGLFDNDDEYDSEDSNASGNPNNDYPDEEEDDDDDEYYDEDDYGGNQYYDDGEQYYDDEQDDDDDGDY